MQSGTTPLSIREVWHLPHFDYIMINVDFSSVQIICAASVGVVARNSADDVVVSFRDYIGLCTSVDGVELRRVSHVYISVSLFISLLFWNQAALFVISLLAHDNLDRSSLTNFKKEALALTKLLPNFKLAKISRQGNEVAH